MLSHAAQREDLGHAFIELVGERVVAVCLRNDTAATKISDNVLNAWILAQPVVVVAPVAVLSHRLGSSGMRWRTRFKTSFLFFQLIEKTAF